MTMTRLLKNVRLDHSTVSQNEMYTFSLMHALSIYPLDAICTFIPKNACSSLRYSIAISNGFLKDINDINWINQNNQTFMSTQREISIASYTFVVLRCPYTRVASCFLDKVVDEKIKFNDNLGNIVNLNFNEFLSYIKSQNNSEMDEHWRHQSDFLHYERYDDYFSLESFSEAMETLDVNGFKVYDTRAVLKHDISGINRIDGDYSKTKADVIKKIKEEGSIPSYKSMYSDEEIELVDDIFRDDINLYKSHFGDLDLLF
jgi:hypothetical protein